MSHVVFPIVWALALAVFAGIIALRMRLLLRAQPVARFDHIGARMKRTLVDGIGQRKFLRGEQPAGIMHALIFWGFVVLMLQVITLFGRAFDSGWNIPGFGPDQLLGPPFFLLRDVLEAVVIVGCVYMLYRRLIVHTPRLFGVRAGRAALPRRPALGGEPDPRLHPPDHGRGTGVRRRQPRREQHSRQRT